MKIVFYKTSKDKYEVFNEKGLLHNEDGPSLELYGRKEYFINGKLHREDGPAIIGAYKENEYWYKGKKITETGLKNIIAKKRIKKLLNEKSLKDKITEKQ